MLAKKSLAVVMNESVKKLAKISDTARLDANLMLKKVLNFKDSELITKSDYILSEVEYQAYKTILERRLNKEPIAYITGSKGFMDYDFDIVDGVLIPRPDTEILVEKICDKLKIKTENIRGLEIGVGSGCISISLLKMLNNLYMRASDISKIAVKLAARNAQKLEVEDRLEVFEADLVDTDLSDVSLNQYKNENYDFIVSNPPYITEKEYLNLMPDVKNYEPKIALYGGVDGLDFYKRIIDISAKILNSNGFIAFEIGSQQAQAVVKLFVKCGFKNIEVFKDHAGKDRVVIGVKND